MFELLRSAVCKVIGHSSDSQQIGKRIDEEDKGASDDFIVVYVQRKCARCGMVFEDGPWLQFRHGLDGFIAHKKGRAITRNDGTAEEYARRLADSVIARAMIRGEGNWVGTHQGGSDGA